MGFGELDGVRGQIGWRDGEAQSGGLLVHGEALGNIGILIFPNDG